jgi:heme/copper-type cytochrome/quinol oxidase subunit 3
MSQSIDPHAVEHPQGIHLPKPSVMPLVWGTGFMLIAFGIITEFYYLSAAGLAVILAATGGWLWGNIRERLQPTETPTVAAKFAMWCFLGTEVVIFGALIGRVLAIWVHEPEAHAILTEPLASLLLVSANTFLLLLSSLAVVLGLASIQAGNPRGLAGWLAVTALLGATFVGVQAYEFNKLVHEGIVFGQEQFDSAFYMLTGNHGLHVIIGVIWCLVVVSRTLRGGFSAEQHLGVEIFGLYWHFVDVVWILIFTLVYLI